MQKKSSFLFVKKSKKKKSSEMKLSLAPRERNRELTGARRDARHDARDEADDDGALADPNVAREPSPQETESRQGIR